MQADTVPYRSASLVGLAAALSGVDRLALRGHVSSALYAVSLALYLATSDVSSPPMSAALVTGCLALAVSPRSAHVSRVTLALAGVVIVSSALAAVAPFLWSDGIEAPSVLQFPIMALFFGLLVGADRRILPWLMPAIFIHAAMVIGQGIGGAERAIGFGTNPNPAAGFLLAGAIIMLVGKRPALALPLIYAQAFTGSRLAALVLAVVLLIMVLRSDLAVRHLAVGAAILTLALLPFMGQLQRDYRINYTAGVVGGDVGGRFESKWARDGTIVATGDNLSLFQPLPLGIVLDTHSVPLRVAKEYGIAGVMAWGGLTLWWLVKGRRARGPGWYLLLAVTCIGILDPYVWIFPLGALWWLAIHDLENNAAPTT